MDLANYWLAFGVGFLLLEAFGASGIGLLFAGFGAITTGALVHLGVVAEASEITQSFIFLTSTALWAAILWKPMKRIAFKKNAPGYQNMVGETAYVGGTALIKGQVGEATWSGTIMKAELCKSSPIDELPAGSPATISDVIGATLILKPKIH